MAYTPTQWNTGDDVTATKLNKMENGIANAGSALIVQNDGNNALNKTVQEIYDALESGTPVCLKWNYGDVEDPNTDYVATRNLAFITLVYRYSSDTYRIVGISALDNGDYDKLVPATILFTANSMSAYPTFLKWVRVKLTSLD